LLNSSQFGSRARHSTTNVIKPICSFRKERKFRVSVQGEMSTQGSVPSPTLYNLYINNTPETHGVRPALFADDARLYALRLVNKSKIGRNTSVAFL
jgi:hypothetical protein